MQKSLLLISAIVPIFISGCFDCMVRGIDARTCGRMKHNVEVIESHQKKIAEINASLKTGEYGTRMSPAEVDNVLGNTCDRYRDKPLPANPDTDPKVLLGNYYKNHFCKLYESDWSLHVRKNEVKHSDTHGTMYFVLTDGEQVLEYLRWQMSYTENGYRFGSY